MAPVITVREGITVIQIRKLPVGIREGIAYPTGEQSGLFVNVKLSAIRISFSKYKILFQFLIGSWCVAFPEFNLVLQFLIVDFDRGLKNILFKIPEISE